MIYLLKVNNRNTKAMCEICSAFTIKLPEWRAFWAYITPCSNISHVKFEHVIVGWVINYMLASIRKTVGGFKNKVVSLFDINTLNDYGKKVVYGGGKKLSKPKTRNQSQKNKSMTDLFKLKKK